MLYKSEFRVDAFRLSMESNPEGLLNFMKRKAAHDIGVKLCEQIPFVLNEEKSERRKGVDLNNYPPINPQDANFDHYETGIFAVPTKEWYDFKYKLKNLLKDTRGISDDEMKEIGNLLKDIESK